MKKFVQFFFCYSTRIVEDIYTQQRERATYYKVLGFVVAVKYEQISNPERFLGI